jgi:type IV pilus assembly protein PilM
MLLDIGAKTSNLLFFEKGKVFSRSINLGANSITQDFANESKKKINATPKRSRLPKASSASAALTRSLRTRMPGGHFQDRAPVHDPAAHPGQPDDAVLPGSAGRFGPVRLFLSGGASIMPYTAQFFAEKLNVPVEYFNPLRNVQIDPSINLEELARVAHSLGEVVGLGCATWRIARSN